MRKRILIVEDDEQIRDSLKDVLEERGFEVITAANGNEGVLALKKDARPDLVLLDLMMPVSNGWQFLEQQRAHAAFSDVPVIVISAFHESAKLLNVNAFVPKPFRLDDLIRTVDQLIA